MTLGDDLQDNIRLKRTFDGRQPLMEDMSYKLDENTEEKEPILYFDNFTQFCVAPLKLSHVKCKSENILTCEQWQVCLVFQQSPYVNEPVLWQLK